MRAFLLSLSLLWTLTSLSQNILTGSVRDEKGKPVEMVLVSALNPKDSTIVAYSSTDEQGKYSITLTDSLKTFLLRMAGFNIRNEFRTIENISQKVDWTCTEESTLLREVQIKAQKLWGNKDTLNYLVAAYMRDHDATIGDVLKRLPGIDIKENGTITYQGIPISKFYIENMDALNGMYNIATRGIKAEDVATIQVLEHHQHVRALDDQVPPEAAAINLKLKKEKKGVWTQSADLGLGASDRFLWNITAQAMFFGKKRQHIIIYDTENDGKGSDLLSSHYENGGIPGFVITSATKSPTSPVGNNKRNNYHQLASNNHWKPNNKTEIHVDANFKHDLVRTRTERSTTYMLPDESCRVLVEDLRSSDTQNEANVSFSYEKNAEKEYLQNKLELTGHWSNELNVGSVHEQGMNHKLGVADRIRWVHRTDNGRGFELKSHNNFSSTPQHLSVRPGVFPDILANGQTYASTTQSATINFFSSVNSIEMVNNLRKQRLTFAPTAYANVEHIGMESLLSAGKSIDGDMKYTQLDIGGGMRVRYTLRQFYAQVHLPLSIRPTILSGSSHSISARTRLYFKPSASFNWRITDNWTSNGNIGWSDMPSNWQFLYTAYVLRNHSSLSRYEGGFYGTKELDGRIKLDYKEILSQVFAWIEFAGNRTSTELTYGTHINEQGYSEMQMVRQPNHNTSLQLQACLRKDFDWKELSLEICGGAARGKNQILRQSTMNKYQSKRFSASLKFLMKPCGWVDLDYITHWGRYDSQSEDGLNVRFNTNWSNNLNINTTIVKKYLWFTVNLSHEYNSFLPVKNHEFICAQVRYRIKKMNFILRAENLTNIRLYRSLSIDEMTECNTTYHLQPLTVMLKTTIHL